MVKFENFIQKITPNILNGDFEFNHIYMYNGENIGTNASAVINMNLQVPR